MLPEPQSNTGPSAHSRSECGESVRESRSTTEHRREFYPGVGAEQWSDYVWQAQNSIRTLPQLERIIDLTDDERAAVTAHGGSLPLRITPYLASLMSRTDPREPMRRTHVPVMGEHLKAAGEALDPLSEDQDSPVPNLVHRYPDRVLFLATGFCSTYCRYCTRSRMVGDPGGSHHFSTREWDQQIAYIEAHSEIRDVLLSGGDPGTLGDAKLESLLARLRAIPHVEFIRIGTKVPVVLPQRVTRSFVMILKRHRVWASLHFTHPAEMTPEVEQACNRLADAGIPLGSQTVLLKGINDDLATMRALMHGLLKLRVKPYYLYQCDPIVGSAHFRTPVETGLAIIEGLRGHTSGYAVPQFVVDAPGGGGKIPLMSNYVLGRDGSDLLLRNFQGRVFRYPDPAGTTGADRSPAGHPLPDFAKLGGPQ
jgi:lysine 2,3-aminomutase